MRGFFKCFYKHIDTHHEPHRPSVMAFQCIFCGHRVFIGQGTYQQIMLGIVKRPLDRYLW